MVNTAEGQKINIYDLKPEDLEKEIARLGEPSYRARQIWQGLYRQFWNRSEEFSMLPAPFRARLEDAFQFDPIRPVRRLESSDRQTVKTLFELQDRQAVETVLMKYDDRRTLCISTQVGCAMGCVFCATGQMGFRRHLSSGEIVGQVIHFARALHDQGEKVTNVVIMGMGEPFHNYEATMAAIDRLNNADGMNLGERRFTISTAGLIPSIIRFTNEKRQVNLAISLHAADNDMRTSLLPINKKYPLEDLMEACRNYVTVTGRRITFEWALIEGFNDSPAEARKLIRLVKGMLCHVNVIPLNPTTKFQGKGTPRERAASFKDILDSAGISCTIRMRRGIDIQAGCGQLASRGDEKQ